MFLAWIKISRPVKSNIDFISSVLWYNPDISNTPLFYPTWFRNGITFVGDILNNEGQIMSKAEIENLYGFKITNFFEYHRLKILLTRFLNKLKITAGKFERPCIPHHISIIIHSKNVTKTFYSI